MFPSCLVVLVCTSWKCCRGLCGLNSSLPFIFSLSLFSTWCVLCRSSTSCLAEVLGCVGDGDWASLGLYTDATAGKTCLVALPVPFKHTRRLPSAPLFSVFKLNHIRVIPAFGCVQTERKDIPTPFYFRFDVVCWSFSGIPWARASRGLTKLQHLLL